MEGQVRTLRQDLSRVVRLASGKPLKSKYKDSLQRKYRLREKGYAVVIEELKQRLVAQPSKIKTCSNRIEQDFSITITERSIRISILRLLVSKRRLILTKRKNFGVVFGVNLPSTEGTLNGYRESDNRVTPIGTGILRSIERT